MVRLTVFLTAPTRSAHDLLDALRYISSTTRFEDGCLLPAKLGAVASQGVHEARVPEHTWVEVV